MVRGLYSKRELEPRRWEQRWFDQLSSVSAIVNWPVVEPANCAWTNQLFRVVQLFFTAFCCRPRLQATWSNGVSRFLVVLTLIGTLLCGQTFCCCTARLATQGKSEAALPKARSCCSCCEHGKDCGKSGHPAPCPCHQRRPPVNVVPSAAADGYVIANHVLELVSAVVPDSVVCTVALLDRRDAWEQILCELPRRDRVALAQSMRC